MIFEFKGKRYEMNKSHFKGLYTNDCPEFHFTQFVALLEEKDYQTLQNRIVSYLLAGAIKEI